VRGQGLAVAVDLPGLMIKDEARNPTGSVHDRGMAAAIGRARELSVGRVSIDPRAPARPAAEAFTTLHGLDLLDEPGDGSLPLEDLPWPVEGHKSIAFELVVELGRAPDVIVCPVGRGAVLLGVAKGLQELADLGWIRPAATRLVAVQSEACAPIARAFRKKWGRSRPPRKVGASAASRLLVPEPPLDELVLRALRGSDGTAVAAQEQELLDGMARVTDRLGLAASPELGACVAACRELRRKRWLSREELVVVVEPGRTRRAWTG
jgi:threonine synthase